MATKTALTDIDAQIERLRERRKTLIAKSADRFARAATKSGLAEMEIADEEMASRFRNGAKTQSAGAPASPRGQASGGTGAETAVPHDS
ncbi:TraC family protein (plasmid) [Agrobacterium salinitolerans]|uniref:TraC family protein n=1 Tax=Agrobacterium salinitolerans TaxID=1183413 RepID=UPI001C225AAA|nr:TraC family protein [Agrobacterium salinitolerans]QXC52978.1 TraC family protein [Agrobacterium salinitolerans]